MHTVEQAYIKHIKLAQKQRSEALTAAQRGQLTKKIKRLVRDLKAFKEQHNV